jgi:hypothetical protein
VGLSAAPPNLTFPTGRAPVHTPLIEVSPGHFVAENVHGGPFWPSGPASQAPDAPPAQTRVQRLEEQA